MFSFSAMDRNFRKLQCQANSGVYKPPGFKFFLEVSPLPGHWTQISISCEWCDCHTGCTAPLCFPSEAQRSHISRLRFDSSDISAELSTAAESAGSTVMGAVLPDQNAYAHA